MTTVSEKKRRWLDIVNALYHAGRAYPGGIAAIADATGVNPQVLANRFNPHNGDHMPTLADALSVIELTGDRMVLAALAARQGCIVVEKNTEHDHKTPREVLATFTGLSASMGEVLVDGPALVDQGHLSGRAGRELKTKLQALIDAAVALDRCL